MFSCKDPEKCKSEMIRRTAIQERYHARNEDIIKAAQRNKSTRLSLVNNSHSTERENFRMYSRNQMVQAFLKGKLIYSSFNKTYGEYRFVLKHSFKASAEYERPVHLVIAAHKTNLFDWTIITVIDPASRKFKWDESYEKQTCFCDRQYKLNYKYD